MKYEFYEVHNRLYFSLLLVAATVTRAALCETFGDGAAAATTTQHDTFPNDSVTRHLEFNNSNLMHNAKLLYRHFLVVEKTILIAWSHWK